MRPAPAGGTIGRMDLFDVAVIGVAWLLLAAGAAAYGYVKRFEFAPLFIAGVFLGFPVVVLGVALASGIRTSRGSA
jgi:hypothetical protein